MFKAKITFKASQVASAKEIKTELIIWQEAFPGFNFPGFVTVTGIPNGTFAPQVNSYHIYLLNKLNLFNHLNKLK